MSWHSGQTLNQSQMKHWIRRNEVLKWMDCFRPISNPPSIQNSSNLCTGRTKVRQKPNSAKRSRQILKAQQHCTGLLKEPRMNESPKSSTSKATSATLVIAPGSRYTRMLRKLQSQNKLRHQSYRMKGKSTMKMKPERSMSWSARWPYRKGFLAEASQWTLIFGWTLCKLLGCKQIWACFKIGNPKSSNGWNHSLSPFSVYKWPFLGSPILRHTHIMPTVMRPISQQLHTLNYIKSNQPININLYQLKWDYLLCSYYPHCPSLSVFTANDERQTCKACHW